MRCGESTRRSSGAGPAGRRRSRRGRGPTCPPIGACTPACDYLRWHRHFDV